jgi:hypothetical protein
MTMGLAGALLVFTGIWHALEWAMHGRNKDTARLIPVGILYAALGWMIVTGRFMPTPAWIALALTTIGLIAAYSLKNTSDVPKWVSWAFIAIDVVIIVALVTALAL